MKINMLTYVCDGVRVSQMKCRTRVQLVGSHHAARFKSRIDTRAINVWR
jgi:hypothetical protein